MKTITFLLPFFIISLIGNFIVMKYGNKFSFTKSSQVQDIHHGKIPRMGGLIMIIVTFIYMLLSQNISSFFFLCSLLILIPALLEDFGMNIKPSIRFCLILLATSILVLNLKVLPQFEIEFLDFILNNNYFQVIFFSLALATVVNGQNIIDGTNGLSASTGVIIFLCIALVSYECGNFQIFRNAVLMVALLVSFLIFNYPFGKLFLGDSGSYLIGLMGGYWVIEIFAENPQIPTWSAAIILYYPTLEVVFSYFRKIFNNHSPFHADNKHLHLKLYFLISKMNKSSRLYNALVAPFLSIIWLSPLAILPLSLMAPHFSIFLNGALVLIYLFFYYSIPDPD